MSGCRLGLTLKLKRVYWPEKGLASYTLLSRVRLANAPLPEDGTLGFTLGHSVRLEECASCTLSG